LFEEELNFRSIFLGDVLVRTGRDKAENIRQRRFCRIVGRQTKIGEREFGVATGEKLRGLE
jgi:hypothetical protein